MAVAEGERREMRNVLDILVAQHGAIRQLFADVASASIVDRYAGFEPLVRQLAVHETAEEEVVYPVVRRIGPEAAALVEDRLAEESAARKMLAHLERLGPENGEFGERFATFRADVEAHAAREETFVLPLLAQAHGQATLQQMGTLLAVAEAVAPTRAHAVAPESAVGNIVVGSFVAVVDRVRDAIRDARARA